MLSLVALLVAAAPQPIPNAAVASRVLGSSLLAKRGTGIVFEPGGARFFTGALVWDAVTGLPQSTLPLASDPTQLVFAPSGQLLVLEFRGLSTMQLNAPTPRLLVAQEGARTCTVNPADGTIVLAVDSKLLLFSKDGASRGELQPPDQMSFEPAGTPLFSPDGKWFATRAAGRNAPVVLVFDWASKRVVATLAVTATALAFAPDSRELLLARMDLDPESSRWVHRVAAFDVKTWEQRRAFLLGEVPGGSGNWDELLLTPDGRRLAARSAHGIRVFETSGGALEASVPGPVGRAAFSPDGKVFAVWRTNPDFVARFAVSSFAPLAPTDSGTHSRAVMNLTFSEDGQGLYSGGTDTQLRAWDVTSGTVRASSFAPQWQGSSPSQLAVATLSSIGEVVSIGENGVVGFLDPATLTSRGTFTFSTRTTPYTEALGGVMIPGTDLLAFAFRDGRVELVNGRTRTGAGTVTLKGKRLVAGPVLLDGAVLVADEQTLFAVDTARRSSQSLPTLGVKGIGSLAVSSGGRLAVSARDTVVVLDRTMKSTMRIDTRGLFVSAVVFSPDERQLILGARPEKKDRLLVTDLATGRMTKAVDAHDNDILVLARSPDGKLLASGSADSTIRLWAIADLLAAQK